MEKFNIDDYILSGDEEYYFSSSNDEDDDLLEDLPIKRNYTLFFVLLFIPLGAKIFAA